MSSAASVPEPSTSRPWRRWVRWPPVPTRRPSVGAVAVAVLAIVLLVRANDFAVLMNQNADSSAPIAMAEYAHRYDDAQLVTGRLGWWGGLWFLQVIRPLPGNTYLASYLPMLLTVAVAALLAFQSRRLWGRRAPWVVVLVALAVPAGVWTDLAAWSARAPSWWAMGLLGAVVIAAARPMDRRRSAGTAVAAVAACSVTAVAASGDQEAAIALVPLAAAGLYALRVRRVRLGGLLLVAAVATLLTSRLIASIAEDQGYLRQAFPVEIIDFSAWGTQFSNLLLGVINVWTGPTASPGAGPDLTTRLGTASGYLGLAIVAAAVVVALNAAWRAWTRRPLLDGERELAGDEAGQLALQRGLWVTFWAVGLGVYLGAFWLTTAQGGLGAPISRYLYGVPMAAAAAIAPAAASQRGRLVSGATVLLALAVLIAVVHRPPKPGVSIAHVSTYGRIGQIAKENGARRGFAGYWMSYPLAMQSGFTLDVTPIGQCSQTAGLCAMYLHYIDQAYAPQAGIRSFLVVDTSEVGKTQYPFAAVTALPPGLDPEKVVDAGEGVQVAIFDHDVAADLEANRSINDPRIGRGGPLPPT